MISCSEHDFQAVFHKGKVSLPNSLVSVGLIIGILSSCEKMSLVAKRKSLKTNDQIY